MPWITDGGYRVLKQEHEQSCGYCCIGMVLNLVDQRQDTESSLVATGRQIGGAGAYDRAAKDRVGAVRTFIVDAAEEQSGKLPHWGSGTYGDHLAQVLREGFHMNAKYHAGKSTGDMKGAMRAVSANQYMIALVLWNGSGGGGHWVLVTSRATRGWGSASNYTVLDPGGSVVTNRGSTTYTAANGATGNFAGYYVLVQGRAASKGVTGGVKVM